MEITQDKLIGKTFMSPMLDYVLIGGAWSILAVAYLLFRPETTITLDGDVFWMVTLLVNSAHFAASTVRLYSKAEYYKEFSFLTFVVPAITLLVLSFCIIFPTTLGKYLMLTYLIWSPFHFAKQTYGLSLMYTFRNGLKVDSREKRIIYWVCMLPFIFSIGTNTTGFIAWITSPDLLSNTPFLYRIPSTAYYFLMPIVYMGPIMLYVGSWLTKDRPLPLIVPLMMIANGVWFTTLPFIEAFVVATIAHSIQYLAILLVYHVREQTASGDTGHAWYYYAAKFYGACVVLGYALFSLLPFVFVWMGSNYAQSALLVLAMINIHHFVVDAYIWRLRIPTNRVALADKMVPAQA